MVSYKVHRCVHTTLPLVVIHQSCTLSGFQGNNLSRTQDNMLHSWCYWVGTSDDGQTTTTTTTTNTPTPTHSMNSNDHPMKTLLYLNPRNPCLLLHRTPVTSHWIQTQQTETSICLRGSGGWKGEMRSSHILIIQGDLMG